VQKESQSPTTFGILADGDVQDFGKGVHYFPSPGGRHTAFLRGKDLVEPTEVVIMTAAGKETFAAKSPEHSVGRPSAWPNAMWSPDGSQLAHTLADKSDPDRRQVHVVNADGSGRRQLTSEAAYYDVVGWTANRRVLVTDYGSENAAPRLLIMGAKCVELPLPEGAAEVGVYPQPSPHGRYVAVYGGSWEEGLELWLLDVQTGESRFMADMGYVATRPASGLYVSAGIPLGLEPAETDDLLLKGPPPVIWSPDGSRIAYYRSGNDANGAYVSELRVVNVESGLDISVAQDPSWQAAWSPDGRYLAEPTHKAQGILLLRPDGSTAVLDVRADQLLWTGDGMLLAAHPGGISLVDPNSGEVQAVLTAEGDNVYGAGLWGEAGVWSPDGRYVAFATSKDYERANGSLYVLDAQTGDVTLIVEEGSFRPVAWLSE
jgi:WD40 repeat protein